MSRRRAPIAERLSAATAQLSGPVAVVDVDAFDRNAATLVARSHGKPIRIATKSLRSRPLIERALEVEGYAGLMCYSVAEAIWWARSGHRDIMVAYPSADIAALTELAADPALVAAITVMIDSPEHVDFLARSVPAHEGLRVALDIDASLEVGTLHLGVNRSPLRTAAQVESVIHRAQERALVVSGLMCYDAQIAGISDKWAAVRAVKAMSDKELQQRRGEVVAAARALTDLDFVNGGGTGSLHVTGTDPALTELAAGSGLYAPTLFDGYDGLELDPAAFFGLDVVRRAADDIVTVYGGGYIASGPQGWHRAPAPLPEHDVAYVKNQGPGEVQTPLKGRGARSLSVGDRVWFRHAKAGELGERFTELALVSGGEVVGRAPTYRGEGKSFG